MKILYVINSLAGGGAEKLINDLLPLLDEAYKPEVLILTETKQKYMTNLQNRGIPVDVVPQFGKNNWKRFLYIRKFILKGNYDIVHANLFPVTYLCSLAKKTSGKKFPILIMTEHNTNNRRREKSYLRPLEKWIYQSYDHVISISDKTQEALVKWLNPSQRNREKFSVIYNGIPLNHFYNAKGYEKKELSEEFKVNDVLLCMIGSFSLQKNHMLALNIMKELPENYHLLFVGEGQLLHDVEEKTKELSLKHRVHFLGFRKDIAQILKTVDISIVPSKWEGFGLVAVEAMACGTPVVASHIPGLSEVVGESEMLAEKDDVRGFVNCILRLNNKEIYKIYSLKAYEKSKQFDISKMKEGYCQIYEKLQAEKRKGEV